jgi:polyisoprenoid-binding protein YceI
MKRSVFTLLSLILFIPFCKGQQYILQNGKTSFYSDTPIESIEAITTAFNGGIDLTSGEVLFVIPIQSFQFSNALMKKHFNESYLESEKYPNATFKGKVDLSKIQSKDGIYHTTVTGNMTIHGVTKNIHVEGTVKKNEEVLTIQSAFPIQLTDYNIKVPKLVIKKIAETVQVNIESVLKKHQ